MHQACYTIGRELASEMRLRLSADAFQRWFAAIELVGVDEFALTFRVPNTIHQSWIQSNYLDIVKSAAVCVLGTPREIKFLVADGGRSSPVSSDPVRGTLVPASPEEDSEDPLFHGMNPRNRFEAFVVGSNNQLAHAAALAVSQSPAKTYNPLFIYGGVGMGKTHLMQAIGQQAIERKKAQKVMYLSSEGFTNEFIDAIQQNMLVKFRKRYRQTDVLLIDDVQFLAGKERSQEEFFHTFNTLFDGRKQIVLSSDRPPSEIANLEQRLVSRLECGLTTELQPPDIDTRMAILRRKAAAFQIKLREDVLAYLAQHVRTNVRRLEGALTRVTSYQSLNGIECSPETAEQLLRDILRVEAKKPPTIEGIQKQVAEHFGVRLADMTGKRRSANVVFPRQIAMYLARRHTKSSFHEIGEIFGGRHHGTVLHACKTVSMRMKNEDQVRQTMAGLAAQLAT
ncbi:MAG: chromosomal replication initiator protein DnaA [Verrucomicrobia bacterium]|nr:chromosomal replication initiator protein DnaA [Verrucomicrobiota bacterium]